MRAIHAALDIVAAFVEENFLQKAQRIARRKDRAQRWSHIWLVIAPVLRVGPGFCKRATSKEQSSGPTGRVVPVIFRPRVGLCWWAEMRGVTGG